MRAYNASWRPFESVERNAVTDVRRAFVSIRRPQCEMVRQHLKNRPAARAIIPSSNIGLNVAVAGPPVSRGAGYRGNAARISPRFGDPAIRKAETFHKAHARQNAPSRKYFIALNRLSVSRVS